MSDKFLCVIATFDDETSKQMKELEHIINSLGIIGKQTPGIPHHITLAYFDVSMEEEIKKLLKDVCAKTDSFNLAFNHIGLFGLKVMFLAPDVNYELLDLYRSFEKNSIKSSRDWTAHATILIDEAENIQKSLPLVTENFNHINSRVVSLSLYEFFPTRFIGKYDLQ